ncbi:SAM-dependent methyltransferase [Alkalihalobacillus alcalophilus ATCC 27647 = CGMCC 1.3604]|uniref:SAM-dependent methyltransferase n=1 Tax=Alkalihalobacillus alcalophilus ATCC 27647 = CGMCC 1.3604 TaxID=1218173 RepID=A0A094XAW6_ALKAL|nr:tRNA (adenine(22)-N(1))-methyltransferase TrmK [Alkalihalobacillus alcalophilus]KGA95925.1 SAM-dependent methyltransferase [Alkalihalobacillus alcalophilus ATCC 27647 = CGMCC 1.3604]MED1563721.1 tRNA (adenine(22)-N(1))-methyltransferase TrmK [Alkalihalobacillus alcalophilus]THG89685.1 SAM-dependent methyltransferase [Alkalihalobacillus alcalophilus ATCC 27647 = CGMCC 1.3604]
MNERHLSERLLKVADFVPEGANLADIGSDHAYLPTYLALHDATLTAIAGEVNEGPYQSAVMQVKRSELTDRIKVRKGDGLNVIEVEDQINVISIAGMGGALIQTILEQGKDKLGAVERLILQPNVGAIFIREWLSQNGWVLIDEAILEEDEKIYEVLVAEKGTDQFLYKEQREAKLLLGPFLMKQCSAIFKKKWGHELKHWQQILKRLETAKETESNEQRKKELEQKILITKEALS